MEEVEERIRGNLIEGRWRRRKLLRNRRKFGEREVDVGERRS